MNPSSLKVCRQRAISLPTRVKKKFRRAGAPLHRHVFEHALEAILILDPEREIVIDANPAACALYGYTREEIVGTSMLARSKTPEASSHLIDETRRAAVGRPAHFSTIQYRRDGSEVCLEVNASVFHDRGRELILTINRDVTERAAMADKIRHAANEWRLTVDAIQAAILLVDTAGRILRANTTAAALAATSLIEISSRRLADFGAGEPWKRASELVTFVSEHGVSVSAQATDAATGSTWYIAATPATDDTGVTRAIIVMRDVTAVIAMEATLQRNERMAEMGRLVAGVAHEVRNPLFTISATLDALEKRLLAAAPGAETYLENLRRAIGRLSTLMGELLDFGKPPSLHVTTEPLANAVADALNVVKALADERRVAIVSSVLPGDAVVIMDRPKLAQALHNLLDNAVHHSPAGEQVTVAAHNAFQHAQNWVVCTIEDRGTGFSEEDMPRLFEPFYTKRKEGTGLGLAIVQRIVEHHGGRVSAERRPGGGARMIVMLPRLVDGELDGQSPNPDR